MKRRTFLQTLGLGMAATALPAWTRGQAAPAKSRKPNIVYILADDLGYNELGCYGQKLIRTPHLDKICAEGMKFTQHYTGQAVCAPARCVLMTGLHTGHSYVRNNRELKPEGQIPLPADTFTMAKMLKKQGYATGCVGKWGLGGPGTCGDPLNQGFDFFYGYNCQRHAHFYYPKYLWKNDKKVPLPGNNIRTGKTYSADLMANEVLSFVKDNKDKPFFLYWPTPVPHVSLQVPEDSLKEYLGKWKEKPYPERGRGYTGHKTPRAAYAAMITRMDREIGKLMALLKKLGLDDNTLVMFAGDNGTTYTGGVDYKFFKSVGKLRGLKGRLYEGGIRVPMIARWPGKIKPGSVTNHVSAFWDVLPTVAEITDTKIPVKVDGVSFAPTLLGKPGQKEHEYLYWEFTAYGGQQAVRMGDWKAIRIGLLKKHNAPIQLYNLKEDISEKNNVAAKHPEIVAKIKAIMKSARVPSKEFPFKALDNAK